MLQGLAAGCHTVCPYVQAGCIPLMAGLAAACKPVPYLTTCPNHDTLIMSNGVGAMARGHAEGSSCRHQPYCAQVARFLGPQPSYPPSLAAAGAAGPRGAPLDSNTRWAADSASRTNLGMPTYPHTRKWCQGQGCVA